MFRTLHNLGLGSDDDEGRLDDGLSVVVVGLANVLGRVLHNDVRQGQSSVGGHPDPVAVVKVHPSHVLERK